MSNGRNKKIPCSRSNNNFDQITAVVTYDFSVNVVDGLNVLGLVVFSVALGIIIRQIGRNRETSLRILLRYGGSNDEAGYSCHLVTFIFTQPSPHNRSLTNFTHDLSVRIFIASCT